MISNDEKSGQRKRDFGFNLFCGILIFILTSFVLPKWGQTVTNMMYDYLVREDFKAAVTGSREKPPISDRIRIVAFSSELNREENGGFWTPRELLGKSILRALKIGARVVVLDIAPNTPAPVCEGKDDENTRFLDLLELAALEARKSGAVILLPYIEIEDDPSETPYVKEYRKRLNDIIHKNKDVIHFGSVGAFKNSEDSFDSRVRHFQFYEIAGDKVYFSLQILAINYLWHGREEGNRNIREKSKEILDGNGSLAVLTNPESGRRIYVHPQNSDTLPLEDRYLFRIAPREVTRNIIIADDPLVRFPELLINPCQLLMDNKLDYKDRVVLIGSADPTMGDVHLTPLGSMNGIFLIANGINQIINGLQIFDPLFASDPSEHFRFLWALLKWGIELGLIVVVSKILSFCPGVPGHILVGIPVCVITFYSSIYLFREFAVFLDVFFPTLGIFLSWMTGEIREKF